MWILIMVLAYLLVGVYVFDWWVVLAVELGSSGRLAVPKRYREKDSDS